jgi:hypothetical protein
MYVTALIISPGLRFFGAKNYDQKMWENVEEQVRHVLFP